VHRTWKLQNEIHEFAHDMVGKDPHHDQLVPQDLADDKGISLTSQKIEE
jgi:hypothetical protein